MFSSLGLFGKIPCPKGSDCSLLNCFFQHDYVSDPQETPGHTQPEIYDPASAGEIELPPAKRRRLNSGTDPARPSITKQNGIPPVERVASAYQQSQPKPKPILDSKPTGSGKIIATVIKPAEPKSVSRTVSPPPRRATLLSTPLKEEKLIPRPVVQAPAPLKTRLSLVELLHKQMKSLNDQTSKTNPSSTLSAQELIRAALDEEEEAATKLTTDIYRNAVPQRIVRLKRMSVEDWGKFVSEKHRKVLVSDDELDQNNMQREVRTGLPSIAYEVKMLNHLQTKLEGLEMHGYVTAPPSAPEIQKSKDGVAAAGGYEVCDRCNIRFQVFPGRDEHGRLTTQGACYYHWGKVNRSQMQRSNRFVGQTEAVYPCCSRTIGSEGCTQADTHVFKVTDPKRLASVLQFESTPTQEASQDLLPVAFDCEMAYTTYGMELIRVTALSWPEKTELLDVLVRPYGEILDFNTRFSGVSKEQYAEACPYEARTDRNTDNTDNVSEDGELEPKSLQKVDSPAAARQLMFNLLTPETPLIGHAIDNDLIACRMIHPFVVDTILLYPHPRGLPIRYGLKMLTAKYLSRSIQNGGELGHDSREDSIATADLVRVKVRDEWKDMQIRGWTIQAGDLVAPK